MSQQAWEYEWCGVLLKLRKDKNGAVPLTRTAVFHPTPWSWHCACTCARCGHEEQMAHLESRVRAVKSV